MKKNLITVIFALVAGAACMFLRGRQLSSGYDAAGLHLADDPLWPVLVAVCAAAVLIIVLLTLLLKDSSSPEAAGNPIFMGINCLSAVILAGYCAFRLICFRVTGDKLNDFLFPILGLVSVVCTISFASGIYKGREGKKLAACGAIPVFFICFWLILCYRDNAAEPVTSLFIFKLLAIIFTAVSLCVTAQSFIYEKPSRWALPTSAAALFFALVALADYHAAGSELLFIYAGVTAVCNGLMANGHCIRSAEKTEE